MPNNNFIANNFKPGQGLLEAILALGIILVGLGAILTFTLKNISAAADSGQRIVAANLAREGIDVVRGTRDSNWLVASNSDPNRIWDENLVPSANDQGAALDFVLPAAPNTPASWQIIFLSSREVADSEYEVYRHAQDYDWRQFPSSASEPNYIPSGYNRILLLDPICDSAGTITAQDGQADCGADSKIGIKVTATVSWAASGFFSGGGRRSLSLIEYIYNWR